MMLTHKRVAIIGAGPVGLTMARLLQLRGVSVTVYERDQDDQARIWGGTLDLHQESGQLALEKAGLLDRYFALAKPMGRTVADHQGKVLFTRRPTPENQYDHPEISRNELRTMLLESLISTTVVWDRKLTGLDQQNGQWQLHFEGQPDATADVVIGANGGLSTVRPYVTKAQVEETGTFIIQGEVRQPQQNCPGFYHLCGGNILMSSYGGNLLVANPNTNGALAYGLTFQRPDEWAGGHELDFQQLGRIRTFVSERLVAWDERYHHLVEATSAFVGLSTRKLPLDKPWEADRPLPITLIGDAAHLMPPFAGQGVNSGLMDAAVLAGKLTEGTHKTLQAAIHDYEQTMFAYARDAQRASSENERAMRHPDFTFHRLVR